MRSVYPILITLCMVSVCHAGILVGIAVDPNSPFAMVGLPYQIDPMTGAATLITQNFTHVGIGGSTPGDNHLYLAAGDSPYPATIFGGTGPNLYTADFAHGIQTYYSGSLGPEELAYDQTNNLLYGTDGTNLEKIPVTPCDMGTCLPPTPVGSFPVPILAMGYVNGDGLYGVDAEMGMLWRIDGNTAHLTLVGPTGVGLLVDGMSMTDIEFDSTTGRMIATAGGPEPTIPLGSLFGGATAPLASGRIYLLDRFTGATTLLNGNAPNFYSLVEVSPEPASLIPVGAVLLVLALRSRARRQ